ncbi:MAG: molybdenum cofactor guanylyltransferase [Acidobacteria bacterium]|nr:molybdenum cofactor guanylyltransferase [Acidobacteriota bacterium]
MAEAGPGVAGFVLAGGESRRMGRDKAMLGETEPMVLRMVNLVKQASDTVFVVAPAGRYEGLGVPVLVDLWPGEGPVGGVLTALAATSHAVNLVVAVDMPKVNPDFLRRLASLAVETGQSIVPEGPEPLCAAYQRSALDGLRAFFDAGGRRFRDAIQHIPVRLVPAAPDIFVNVNTPEQWEAVRF